MAIYIKNIIFVDFRPKENLSFVMFMKYVNLKFVVQHYQIAHDSVDHYL